jgi:uncharacterized protein (TIGR00255 family)
MSGLPVRSMTGFASVRGAAGEVGFTLTLKSVNHRHLDLAVRLPMGLDGLESTLRKTVKDRVRRGHVELGLQFDKVTGGGKAELNEALLATYVAVYRKAASLHGLSGEPNVNDLLRLPGVLTAESSGARSEDPGVPAAVVEAMPELLTRFEAVREAEGSALAEELRAGMARLAALVEEVAGLRLGVVDGQQARLRARLAELLEGSGVVAAEERILVEAAVLAERGDVDEELVRLRTHVGRFVDMLDAGGETGRPLDFLLQEMNREANTLLSKTGGSAGLRMTEVGLQMKVELERAREQVQNLE